MSILLGNNNINNIKIGSIQILKALQNNNVIWERKNWNKLPITNGTLPQRIKSTDGSSITVSFGISKETYNNIKDCKLFRLTFVSPKGTNIPVKEPSGQQVIEIENPFSPENSNGYICVYKGGYSGSDMRVLIDIMWLSVREYAVSPKYRVGIGFGFTNSSAGTYLSCTLQNIEFLNN